MKKVEDYIAFLEKNILPSDKLKELEDRRLEVRQRKFYYIKLTAFITLLHLAIVLLQLLVWWTIPIQLFLTTYILIRLYNARYDHDISNDFKRLIVPPTIKFIDPLLEYNPKGFLPFSDFKSSGLFFQEPDNYSGEDLFIGKIDGIPIRMSELYVSYESNGDWNTIFRGLFFIMDRKESFNASTIILSNDMYGRMGYLGKVLQQYQLYRDIKVRLFDPEQEYYFTVYTNHLLEAKKILAKTEIIEVLMNYRKEREFEINISFFKNTVFIALHIDDKDLFDINMKKSLLDIDLMLAYFKEFEFLMALAKAFS